MRSLALLFLTLGPLSLRAQNKVGRWLNTKGVSVSCCITAW
jgi:hypothetical protein